jgi:cytoskeletal protein RodZ
MNAKEFFEKHSIEEISKKTKISPISLRYIRNKEFDKLPRVKFVGFVKLMEREFKVDLSELIEEYDDFQNPKKEKTKKQKEEKKELKNENDSNKKPQKDKSLLIVLIAILCILGAYLIYLYLHSKNSFDITPPPQKIQKNFPKRKDSNETNQTETNSSAKIPVKETNTTNIKSITIIPHQLLWFKAVNLDNNKTFEFLTSHEKTLPGSDYYLKLGHGNETIIYGDLNITPNTKKIVRIILKNGKYKYVNHSPFGAQK